MSNEHPLPFLGPEADRDVRQYYEITNTELGKGSYGTVQLGRLRGTKLHRAIKIIDKAKVNHVERFQLEVEIMMRLNHPTILRLFDYFEDEFSIYLILEVCSGGELFGHIIEHQSFNEHEARIIFKQISKAIYYCHLNGVCHRDLKPENFIMVSKNHPFLLKVIDFGLSRTFPNSDNGSLTPHDLNALQLPKLRRQTKAILRTKAGTPFYIAPEVLSGNYTEKCDVWSCGVILYILLCGYPPFYGDNNKEILDSVRTGKLDFPDLEWKDKSPEAIDLIKKILCPPETRLFADEVIKHPWMQSKTLKTHATNFEKLFSNMKLFAKLSPLKKSILFFIAHNLYEEDLMTLHDYFYLLDPSDQGCLQSTDFQKVTSEKFKVDTKEAESVFQGLDFFSTGKVSFTQFVASTIPLEYLTTEKKLNIFLKLCDVDRDEHLSLTDFKRFLNIQFKFRSDVSTSFKGELVEEFSNSKLNGAGFEDFKEFFAHVII